MENKKFILFKALIAFLITTNNLSACLCESEITSAFNSVEQEIIDNNLNKINENLEDYKEAIDDNTAALEKQTDQYKKLVDHEKTLALKLKVILFELRNANDKLSKQNEIIANDVNALIKQNEEESLSSRLLEKER